MTTRLIRFAPYALFAGLMVLPNMAFADPLEGMLTDGLTGYPIEGSVVRIAGTALTTTTDAEGRWSFDLPEGVYQVDFESTLGSEVHKTSLVRQAVPQYKPANARHYTSWFSEQGLPASSTPMGVPTTSGKLPADAPDTIVLPDPVTSPLALTVTDPIPRRIRVGRRQRPEEGCRNNPVIAIEEMDIDDYVKGVLPPEIGVFQSIPGALETYKAFGIAAKSYGLWFMLTYDESNRRNVDNPLPPDNYTWFHIDDTACNQRYSDERLTITTQAAEAVANKILVKKNEPSVLDKLEYAASCGRHGTLPEYGTTSALVPDMPPVNACAGRWCGHDSCAGHEDNPNLAGSDRCLVRGMCQWGTASWGESGRDYIWILQHYQPNLELRDLQGTEPVTEVEIRGYVYTRTEDIPGSALPGIDVTLNTGQSTTTNTQGVFSFTGVPLAQGSVTLTVNTPGYAMASQDKQLVSGEINWASIQLVESNQGGVDMGMRPVDMGTPTGELDMGSVPMPLDQGMTPGSPSPDQGGGGVAPTPGVAPEQDDDFAQILTTSSGVDGGCAHTTGSRAPIAPLAACLGLCFGMMCWRRRRDVA